MPELRHLRAFVAVAEQLSFTRAAESLGMTQQSVSKAIGELERELGFALFERTTREVRLTGPGEALLEGAADVLGRLAVVVEHARDVALGLRGAVRLGVTPAVGPLDREALVDALRDAGQELSVSLREVRPAELRPLLRAHELDVAVTRVSGTHDPSLHSAQLRPTPMLAAVRDGHRLAGRDVIELRELDGERMLVASPAGTPFTDMLVSRIAASGATVEPVEARVTGGSTLLTELRRVDAVAIVPAGSHRPAGVTCLEVRELALPLWLLWPAGLPSAAVHRLRAALAPGPAR